MTNTLQLKVTEAFCQTLGNNEFKIILQHIYLIKFRIETLNVSILKQGLNNLSLFSKTQQQAHITHSNNLPNRPDFRSGF